jgi:hypothetical protein
MSEPRMSPRRRLGRWRAAHPSASGFATFLLAFGVVVAACAAFIAWAWSAYVGPGPGVADRIRAAHDSLMVGVEFRNPNPIEGAPGEVWVTLVHEATRDEVDAFWCGVVVPAGGATMYRDHHLVMWQKEQQTGAPEYELGIFVPSLTCPPVADPRPWMDPTPVPTEPLPVIYGSCTDTYANPINDCERERAATLLAVGHLGYYPLSVEIHPGGFPCGEPFEDRQPAETCPGTPGTVVAYVLFVGTDKVAALALSRGADGYTATLVSFQEPPSSFNHFLYWPRVPDNSPTAKPSGG